MSGNGLLAIFFFLAVWGFVVDFRYRRKGGSKPSRTDRVYLWATVALLVVLMIVLGILGGSPERLGEVTTEIFIGIIFPLWELDRWRVRRKHPLKPKVST